MAEWPLKKNKGKNQQLTNKMKAFISIAAAVLVMAGIGFLAIRTLAAVGRIANGYEHKIRNIERSFDSVPGEVTPPRIRVQTVRL